MDRPLPWPGGSLETPQEIFYVSPDRDPSGKPAITVWKLDGGEYFRILYYDGTEFIIARRGTRIWGTWLEPSTYEDTTVYLRGPILGFVLRLRGVPCLHASAVAVGDQAIALLGPANSGKSTTAAAFAKMGYAVLSDDVVPLVDQHDSILAVPGYPRLCLLPDSTRELFGTAKTLPLVAPNWDKHYLALNCDDYRFQQESLPLVAIYILGEPLSEPAEPSVEGVGAQTGLMALVANTYMNFLLDKSMRAQEFELLSRVAANVPLRRVRSHADPAHRSRLCEVVLEDFYKAVPAALAARSARNA